VCWLFLLAHESRLTAQKESNRQSLKLIREIDAHEQTDRELQLAKENAERANEAKSRYLTGISHELRTPLQSILGYAQLLGEKQEIADEHKRGLSIIHRSGQYLTDLIEGLLDISKIEAGRLDIYRNQVKLPELIDQLAQMFSVQASNKKLKLSCQIHDPLPDLVITDEKRLRQILINLLSNAVKYTPSGEVNFDIRYRNQDAEFAIRDTGPGISAAYLKRIFDPFERVRNSETASLPGTGLGLTIVKLLTEIMGGDLKVRSEEGQGTEFKVSLMLPWIDSLAAEETREQTIIGYTGYQRTLCIVDDDPILRGLLADLLTPIGFRVVEAHDAVSCLHLLENLHPDLFILDISMPGMSGLELAGALRKQGVEAAIVMLSADAREYNQALEHQADYNDYLVKPVSNQQLLDVIAQQLELEWISRGKEETGFHGRITVPQLSDPASATLPKHSLILELKAYAEMGYQKGVNTILKQIHNEGVLPEDSFSYLKQLSDAFQLDKLAHHIEVNCE
jgi:signal transduction histidine kinase/CheY-like chemotaxis protein